MKYILALLLSASFSITNAQTSKFAGDWGGHLQLNVKLRLAFHIKDSLQLSATMDSPDQGAYGIPCDDVITKGDSIYIYMNRIRGKYSALYSVVNDTARLTGYWKQGVAQLPLNMHKTSADELKLERPQHPKAPFPYEAEEVKYTNKDKSVTLAGTLTYPKGKTKMPAVILITGSGQQDRDETIFAHKPFWVIADALTRQGYAVLRVDDRGIGKSEGDVSNATSFDFSLDVLTSFDYLKLRPEINPKQIGLIGHSEGGLIAALAAAQRKDIAFMIFLAGPALPGSAVIEEQSIKIMQANEVSKAVAEEFRAISRKMSEIITQSGTKEIAKTQFTAEIKKWFAGASSEAKAIIGATTEEEASVYASKSVDQTYNPWFRYFLGFDPGKELKKSSCPVLAIFGEKDIQVIAEQNSVSMKNVLAASRSSKNFAVHEVKGVNHMFQHCKSCTVDEYGTLTETFAPEVLTLMIDWLRVHTRVKN